MCDLESNLLWTGKHDLYVNRCCYSPDGSTVLSCSYDKTVKMWKNPSYIWDPNHYKYNTEDLKRQVKTLFTLRETGESQLSILPNELLFNIITLL